MTGRGWAQDTPGPAKPCPPQARNGQIWARAKASAFLLMDDSRYITGQTLRVDGGLSRHI